MRSLHPLLLPLVILVPVNIFAQDRFGARDGEISFFSSTPFEDIKAENHKVASVYDVPTGTIEFSALIKAFEFPKAMMQEHFNEDYLESDKYPKATFKGNLTVAPGDDPGKAGRHAVKVEGDLVLHGVTRHIT